MSSDLQGEIAGGIISEELSSWTGSEEFWCLKSNNEKF